MKHRAFNDGFTCEGFRRFGLEERWRRLAIDLKRLLPASQFSELYDGRCKPQK